MQRLLPSLTAVCLGTNTFARHVARGVAIAGVLVLLAPAAFAEEYSSPTLAPGQPLPVSGGCYTYTPWPEQTSSSQVPLPPPAGATNGFVDHSDPMGAVATPAQPVEVAPELAAKVCDSNWYVRADYFHWSTPDTNLNETGTLVTLGYQQRKGKFRARYELFGGSMNCTGEAYVFASGTTVPYSTTSVYFGGRLEYELVFEPDAIPSLSFFGGVGDRFWLRCAAAGTDANGDAFPVSSELWDTFYPYIGVETRRKPNVDIEWYFSGRIGCTAFTFDCPSAVNTVLLPQPGLTASLELGLRGRTFNVAGYFENMGWGQSPASSGIYSAASQMYQLGLKAGMSF